MLAAEVAGLFKQNIRYTLVASAGSVIWKFPTSEARQWPLDMQNELKSNALEKYNKFMIRARDLQQQLISDNHAKLKLEQNLKIDL